MVKPKLFLFKIHHSEATMLERITRSIQLLKMKILKYPSQRYILETYEVAFNHLLTLSRGAPDSRLTLGIPRSSVASSAG